MPSLLHEQRSQLLRAVGILGGCRVAAHLDVPLRPDVVLADVRGRTLFVGDAKATETAGCAATSRRLRRYVRATTPWRSAGYLVRVALCGAPVDDWVVTVADAVCDVGAVLLRAGTVDFAGTDRVAWADLGNLSVYRMLASSLDDNLNPPRR